MGLPMENLHAPTVSGSTNSQSHSAKEELTLQQLIAEKDGIWSELSALGSVLDSHGVNMNTSLTTFDGYPRSDIDVAQIRTTRARIVRLKNDYKDLMARIEKAMHEHWEKASVSPTPASSSQTPQESQSSRVVLEAPFAKVNTVVPASPAAQAGLRAGDKITRFGDVDWMNHDKLSRVAQTVQQNEGRQVLVKILRMQEVGGVGEQRLELRLLPRRDWGGRGLLGCHLLPL